MGTSTAAGYVTPQGNITNWLNEMAFVPVDYRRRRAIDEWSGDIGCGVQYFSQQGVARLAPLAGLELRPKEMALPERLVEVQAPMKRGDERAESIYAHHRRVLRLRHRPLGGLLRDPQSAGARTRHLRRRAASSSSPRPRACSQAEFPALAANLRLRTPNEQDKRHGQAVAAASLPAESLMGAADEPSTSPGARAYVPDGVEPAAACSPAPPISASARTRTTSSSWPSTAFASAFTMSRTVGSPA
jgi:hypothetical protein